MDLAYGNTALERLAFGDGTLKPSGRVAFIMHDRDGWPVRSATAPVHD